MVKKRGLGKSLDALLAYTKDSHSPEFLSHQSTNQQCNTLPVDLIQQGKYQPRREMDKDALNDLADSIKSQGILQPLIVRPLSDEIDRYEIVAGERRFRAAIIAGLADVPVIIRNIPDEAAIAIALIENIQREDLNPIEEAIALERLMTEFRMTHLQVAETVGKSRTNITNLLRLLKLTDSIKTLLEQGHIEMGHARALITLPEEMQLQAAKAIMEKSLSVRDTEEWLRRMQSKHHTVGSRTAAEYDPELQHVEEKLSKQLKLKVMIRALASGKGKMVIHYKSLAELDHLLAQFESS